MGGNFDLQVAAAGAAPAAPTEIQLLIGTPGTPYEAAATGEMYPDGPSNNMVGDGMYKAVESTFSARFRNLDEGGYYWQAATNGLNLNVAKASIQDFQSGVAPPFLSDRVHQMDYDWAAVYKFKVNNALGIGQRFFVGWGENNIAPFIGDDPGVATIGFQFAPDPPRSDPAIMFMGHDGTTQNVLISTGIAEAIAPRFARIFITGGGTGAVLELLDNAGVLIPGGSRTWAPGEMPPVATRMVPMCGRSNVGAGVALETRFYYAKGVNPL